MRVQTHFAVNETRYSTNVEKRITAQIEKRISYFNHTRTPITIVERNGLKFTLQQSPDLFCSDFIVRVEYFFTHPVVPSLTKALSMVSDTHTQDMRMFKDAFNNALNNREPNGIRFHLDYPIDTDCFRRNGGTFYVDELDIVLSTADVYDAPHHPYSPEGRDIKRIDYMTTEQGFMYYVEIVDNTGTSGCRYMNFSGAIHELFPIKDNERQNGVYITSPVPVTREGEYAPITTRKHNLADMEALGIFTTYEKAVFLGDLSSQKKEELLRLEHDLTKSKKELTLLAQQHEKEVAGMNRQIETLKLENEKHERQLARMKEDSDIARMQIKDEYEQRSLARKDTSESIKHLPLIVTGIGAAIMALRAFM